MTRRRARSFVRRCAGTWRSPEQPVRTPVAWWSGRGPRLGAQLVQATGVSVTGRSGGARLGSAGRVPEVAHPQRIQVVRRCDDDAARTGRDRGGRSQRFRQVERGRRDRLGARRSGAEFRPQPEDGRRHLRRHRQTAGARPRRGHPRPRQLVWHLADRVHRGRHLAHVVPHRRERIRNQRGELSAARRAGAAERRRCRPPAARDRQPGSDRCGAQRPTGRPPGDHRRSRRGAQVPAPQGEVGASPRRHRGELAARAGPAP